jgi:hypothetical protein
MDNNDLIKRAELIKKIKQQGFPSPSNKKPYPIVTLEEFFVGNDDLGSIGCNLIDHPGISLFYETFLSIRGKPNVRDVLVEIKDMEEESEGIWPFSDTIYILTSATREEVTSWVYILGPDEVQEDFSDNNRALALDIKPDIKVYSVWWD